MQNPQVSGESEDERRLRQIELNQPAIALIQSWLDDSEEPTDEERAQFLEFMRDLDAHRPHRPLFTEYICELERRSR